MASIVGVVGQSCQTQVNKNGYSSCEYCGHKSVPQALHRQHSFAGITLHYDKDKYLGNIEAPIAQLMNKWSLKFLFLFIISMKLLCLYQNL